MLLVNTSIYTMLLDQHICVLKVRMTQKKTEYVYIYTQETTHIQIMYIFYLNTRIFKLEFN